MALIIFEKIPSHHPHSRIRPTDQGRTNSSLTDYLHVTFRHFSWNTTVVGSAVPMPNAAAIGVVVCF
ncbi:hypothetical protein CLOP_g24566 [Closterium sp. NIES-67]|nr:hypothetical protein CLOP_g24566 [Closterium sp. NIES-67]